MILVPNIQPTLQLDRRLAIVGEAPGEQEESIRQPFVGPSGEMLNRELAKNGLMRSACFVGNVCQFRPPQNKIEMFDWQGEEIQGGLRQLKDDIVLANPNCIALLGKSALRAAGVTHPITAFRGSRFICNDTESPFFMRKCIALLHPSYIMRVFEEMPLFSFDMKRAVAESDSPELVLPRRTYDVELTADQACAKLDGIADGTLVSMDIEGYSHGFGITCVGFSTDISSAFVVDPFSYDENDQPRVFRSIARVVSSRLIPKVLQNSLYDNFCLAWLWRMPIRNVAWDTMLSGWEIYCELPKGLGTQVSIYTGEPYYKAERKVADQLTHRTYCGKDAACTLEIAQVHQKMLKGSSASHNQLNLELLPAFNYMELRGIRLDRPLVAEKLVEVKHGMLEYQTRMDHLAGRAVNPNCSAGKNSMQTILYKEIGFEPQYTKEKGRLTNKLTCDVEALLTLLKKTESPLIMNILKWRVLEGQRKQLEIEPDADGRVRCSYNLVGTDTGRITCSESPTGTGTNLQTIMKKLRCCYTADPGKVMFQCDLEGADGWTVAARCLSFGDSTMMTDYKARIKPARVIAMMHQHGKHVAVMSQAELKSLIERSTIDEWLYFTCKRVQHGTNYRLQARKMSAQILKDSWKEDGNPIHVAPNDCEKLQALYGLRYRGVKLWQAWAETELQRTRSITCASGSTRRFFGRPYDHDTVNKFLAHEPQHNTTYATDLALHSLWTDPENRNVDNTLIIEPLHQVHDALIGQVDESRVDWAKGKIREWFNHELQIADTKLVIPFDGKMGPDWGTLTDKI